MSRPRPKSPKRWKWKRPRTKASRPTPLVIPAKAGIHFLKTAGARTQRKKGRWVPDQVRDDGLSGPSVRDNDGLTGHRHLILASLNSTCLRATGSYLRKVIFSVMFRGFF